MREDWEFREKIPVSQRKGKREEFRLHMHLASDEERKRTVDEVMERAVRGCKASKRMVCNT